MTKSAEKKPLIMVLGMGDLSTRLLNMLLGNPATNRVVLAGRDVETARRRGNLARFTATNLGLVGEVDAVHIDLYDVDATAETLARVRPDIIFMGASLQSWRVITGLPKETFEELDEAQFGPWLPMHLTLNHLLMRAVRASGTGAKVVNAAFPDAVGPVLDKVGLAPTIGVGNVANIVPALTYGFADVLGADPAGLELRLVAQHYFSHYVPRFGDAGKGAYHLSVRAGGRPVGEDIDHTTVFARLDGPLKRLGGIDGQLLTASSAARVLIGMATDSGVLAHAPAPAGLPGGYPVRVGAEGGTVDLDGSLTLDEAIRLNEDCQRADGIERIDDDGTVTFTEPEMAIMKRLIGYECRTMKLDDTAGWAEELGAKYRDFRKKFA
ncbi:hypothetical protein QZH56_10495 [Streptomyces olivoreticuli]|uniref:Saccharopine dehydrogenase NADP binding domain-containing protein n=1 Tax=Streptomyces blastmyceticus TaxID=68180 RepID=A0ABN0XVG8_9ACTN|nr:hypothetical protein [Streptomyces olivoreticuli]WKK25980.1 hypothetical protein QZH56_10495 [Streptomyces olivoreticuli]